MRQTLPEIIQAYIREEGAFYLCGPTWPVPDVTAVLGLVNLQNIALLVLQLLDLLASLNLLAVVLGFGGNLLGAAFSRDQPEKIYIQDRMRQTLPEIIQAYIRVSTFLPLFLASVAIASSRTAVTSGTGQVGPHRDLYPGPHAPDTARDHPGIHS
jgi:hypothetical protein